VLDALAGDTAGPEAIPDGAIVIAAELLPSRLAALDATRIAGLCLAHGGATSHVAIMAAAMGLPTLVSLGPALLSVADGSWLIVDAETGELQVDPTRSTRCVHGARNAISNAPRRPQTAGRPTACVSRSLRT
jgi:multiphosphoryl transfer protein